MNQVSDVFEMLVDQSLGSNRFVVTNSCRRDIPAGAVFTAMRAEKSKLVAGNFFKDLETLPLSVQLRIDAIEFWRRPWHCVPYGHHAGVQLSGGCTERLLEFLLAHPRPWHVMLSGSTM